MRLISADELCAILIDWQLNEMPEEGVNYQQGRMVTDHERQYELSLLLDEVIKEVAEQKIVKAIPIEWIEKQIEKALSVDSVDLFYVGSLKHLIKEWEKENETN